MRILLLGGVAESKELAQRLIDARYTIIYSIAGLVRVPKLDCELHIGGFSSDGQDGTDGIVAFCQAQRIDLIIDATHPYAAQISANAVAASRRQRIACWRLTRPGWDKSRYATWQDYQDFDDLLEQIAPFKRPFLSVGASALKHAHRRREHQQWVVRSARPQPPMPGVVLIEAIGPFTYADELQLLKDYEVDCLVSKNSGCQRIIHKIDAAHALHLPIFVQQRPPLAKADADFEHTHSLMNALLMQYPMTTPQHG